MRFTRPVLMLVLAALVPMQSAGANASSGHIVPTGSMNVARHSAASALLENGKVLVAGGMPANGVFLRSAETYDPALGTFSPTAEMAVARGYGATATRLHDGTVLVTGGRTASGCTASAERYDDRRRAFTPAGTMHVTRCGAFALPLASGNILIVGGDQDGANDVHAVTSVELYDPKTDTFSQRGATRGDANAAVLLANGLVLIVHEASAELYDPTTDRFRDAGALLVPRHKTGAALLADGRVILFGGQLGDTWGTNTRTTEVFDPQTRRFTRGPEMAFARFKLRASIVPVQDGRFLIAGGAERPEIFDVRTSRFTPVAGEPLDAYLYATTTRLIDGSVLMAGGYGKEFASRTHAWLYRP